MRRTMVARGAAACVLAGTVTVTLAVVVGPTSALTGYVSEAGVGASGYVTAYRLGVLGVAVALLLFATALVQVLRPAAGLLAAGAAGTGLSASVPCSAGCPLPPFEPTTAAGLVHGSASIAAVACVVFAMLMVAWSAEVSPLLRRLGLVGVALALPLSATIGVAMLTVGRSTLVGVVERALLGVIALWLITSTLAASSSSAAPPPPPPPSGR